jgi:hypothetical protein
MVVVASVNYSAGDPPLTTRIQKATGSGFEVRLQRADGSTGSISASVHYTVVEEGVYNEADHGVDMEAFRVESKVTDGKGFWEGEEQFYTNAYDSPVVLGQVMTYKDSGFSTFWAHDGSGAEPPSATSLFVGKHAGEATNRDRAVEEIGYIVIESGSGTIDGQDYAAGVGADVVRGPTVTPATYPLSGFTSAQTAVVSPAAMDGGDGGWPVLAGDTPVTATGLKVFFEEDEFADGERDHTDEQVAYLVFGQAAAAVRGTVVGTVEMETADAEPISDARLQPLVAEALARWQSAGARSSLPDVQFVFADLPGDQLGASAGNLITLDVNAAGVGWFVDDTPWDNTEFKTNRLGELSSVDFLSAATGRYDLLTVISHELGHSLGLKHTDGGLMNAFLEPGERHPPVDLDNDRISDDLLTDLAADHLQHAEES